MTTTRVRLGVSRLGAALLTGLILLTTQTAAAPVQASAVTVTLDGKVLALDPPPVIRENRTLVPLRQIFEALRAEVTWDDATRTVTAKRDYYYYMRFRIGDRLACLDEACSRAALMDVPGQIIDDRTFVPLRFVATALGAKVNWDATTRTAAIEDVPWWVHATTGPRFRVDAPDRIDGTVGLKVNTNHVTGQSVEFFLLDKKTLRGPVIAYGNDLNASYTWRPDPGLNGDRYLVAVAYDAEGKPTYSELKSVAVAAGGPARLASVTEGQMVAGPVKLVTEYDFTAAYIRYTLVDPVTGAETILGDADPDRPFTWLPQMEQNGSRRLVATVYDRNLKAYTAPAVNVNVAVTPSVVMERPSAGLEITSRATFRLNSNFQIERIEIRDGNKVLMQAGRSAPVTVTGYSADQYATFTWTPRPDQNGSYRARAVVYDKAGRAYETGAIPVTVSVQPTVWLSLAPNQIISGPVDVRVTSNLPLSYAEFYVTNPETGRTERFAAGSETTRSWMPPANINGKRRIQVAVRDSNGKLMYSPAVDVRVVTTRTYGPTALTTRDQFHPRIKPLAIDTYRKTNMSASLQVAQATLETGWGQYVATDKYTGQVSNSLFNIKGTGPAGSVLINTWEVFGGITYRVEDWFRAYHSLEQGWDDHKEFLLKRERYAPFRAVMHDPVQGAWGLLRTGYATDPLYAIKLIRMQRDLNLWELDWIEI